ncbi:zinc ABC transporter substrate-binding protein [Pseudactinotalea sp. HY158]|nr:zinc ABC transporter substrate-binding protein [Pseudactinotalea sp. HY158]
MRMVPMFITVRHRRRGPAIRTVGGLAAVALLAGCGVTVQTTAGFAADSPSTLRVATSLYPLEFLAAEVGGDRVEVVNLTPAGAEPHDLELAPTDVLTLGQADLVLALPGFQPAIDDALAHLGADAAVGTTPAVLDVTGPARLLGLDQEDEHEHGHDDGHDHGMAGADPHFWLDPLRLAGVAGAVADALAGLDPAGTADYERNAAALTTRLTALDAQYTAGLAECERRTIVTSHQSFGYLGERYDLTEVSVSGLDPEGEPAPVRIHEIATAVAGTGATTVFTEPLTPPKAARVLGAELGISVALLDPIETRPDGGYLAAAHRNLSALRTALGCS